MMTFEQAKACVLYEDNHLLVVCKPVNMPVQADASGDEDLLTAMKAYVKQAYNKPGEVYLGLVHRLDRPVGGAMVFARTSKAAQRLTEQVKSRKMGRTYWAVVRGNPPESGKLSHFLLKDEHTNTTRAVPEGLRAQNRHCWNTAYWIERMGFLSARSNCKLGGRTRSGCSFRRKAGRFGAMRVTAEASPGSKSRFGDDISI